MHLKRSQPSFIGEIKVDEKDQRIWNILLLPVRFINQFISECENFYLNINLSNNFEYLSNILEYQCYYENHL